jgi:hypothetical protein
LKVRFGLLTFVERESYITEGTDDGGIDAYYIDSERKVIYFLQAKFRTNEKNFEDKSINPEELLMMDIARVLEGETTYDSGKSYNQKVLQMAKKIREINDIGRYNYRVVILANAKGVTRQKLITLTGGFPTELIDHKTCYTKLLFPLVSGTYYHADELQLSLSLSNKSAGAKISYTVKTEFTNCEITVIFVPTLEIAKAMFKYRNSILQYNPRSYLGHEGRTVNREIRQSIENRATNEFALFNNGITLLSDETYLNEKIGQKERAQLALKNPQIINGGQTAYTLSIIYRENLDADVSSLFGEKEVLVKIITFEGGSSLPEDKKLALIQDISRATNQQSIVTSADRRSNEDSVKELQKKIFESTGLFLERKRGEFEDGIREGYIKESEIIERTLFFRAALLAQGRLKQAVGRKLVAKLDYSLLTNVSDELLEVYAFSVKLLSTLLQPSGTTHPAIGVMVAIRVFFGIAIGFKSGMTIREREEAVATEASTLGRSWELFQPFITARIPDYEKIRLRGRRVPTVVEEYLNSQAFKDDVSKFLTM